MDEAIWMRLVTVRRWTETHRNHNSDIKTKPKPDLLCPSSDPDTDMHVLRLRTLCTTSV